MEQNNYLEKIKSMFYLYSSNQIKMRKHLLIISIMILLMVIILLLPHFFKTHAIVNNYLFIHTAIEMFSVVSASLIFAIGWNAYTDKLPANIIFLSTLFFAIAIFDFSHLMSYPGMPNYITASTPEKAINFWLTGRLLAAVGLFIFSISSLSPLKNSINRYILFLFIVLFTLFTHWIFFFHSDLLPQTFIQGQGLTNYKIYTEYVIIGFHIFTIMILWIKMKQPQLYHISALFTAISIMIMSELFFTLYTDLTDIYNLSGHIYKAIAYLYIYKVLFVTTVRQPYESLDKSQAELLIKNTLLDTIIDNIPNMLFLKDAKKLKFVRLNFAGEKLLGLSKDDFIGKNDYDFFTKEEADFFTKSDKKVFETKHILDIPEERIDTPLGVRILHTKKVPIFDNNGNPEYLLGISEDITESKIIEQKLKDQEEMMIVQSRQAAMGEMISMIAHQWRQPLSVISMSANNILLDVELKELSEENIKKGLESINEQITYMSRTIDDFRNFFKRSKNIETEYMHKLIDEVLLIIGSTLKAKNIEVRINCSESITVKTFKSELTQVIINILSNAKDSMQNQSEDKIITINVSELDDNVILSITNQGPQIPNDIIDKIFEPYFTTKETSGGTGLGLYMSKSIIEKHMHGNIVCRNTESGVEFIVTIPKITAV